MVCEVKDISQGVTVEKLLSLLESRYGIKSDSYLDYTRQDEEENIYSLPLNPKIKPWELEEAKFWRDYARGKIGIFALEGTGKTLLLIAIAIKMHHFFLRPIVLDFHPRQALIDMVGEDNFHYVDEEMLLDDLRQADKVARDEEWNIRATSLEKEKWVLSGKGNSGVKLQGCTFGMSEIDRWCNRRRCMSKINHLVTPLFTQWRHNDILIVGDCNDIKYLDPQRIGSKFSTIVYPVPLGNHQFSYVFKSVQRLTKNGVEYTPRVDRLVLDGRDFYPYYRTRNPIAIDPSMREKVKAKEVEDTGDDNRN